MQRHKLLAFVVGALVAFGGASVLLLGNAQAATWHDYKGDLFAGHAYGLQVPENAQAYEILLEGDAGAMASLALYDPAGKLLGHHVLDAATSSVAVEKPAPGRHVVYVYDLEGALRLRVDALLSPVSSSLQRMPLYKEEVELAVSEQSAALDLSKRASLKSTPAFVTLLYEGSVRGLDATVASAKGDVVSISGESGTAFAPGVWSSLSGERSSAPQNLDGLAYTVTATAERFQGSLVLVALTIDHQAPIETPETPAAPPLAVNGAFNAPVGKAIAFTATKGAIRVTDVEPVVEKESEHKRRDYWRGAISIYAPDDSLLAYVTLSDREPNATIKLPVDGEYVAYVHQASKKGLLVQLVGATQTAGIRELTLAQEEFTFALSSGFQREGKTFQVANTPVAMKATLSRSTFGAFSWADVSNANGHVAGANTLVSAPGVELFDWSGQNPENFAAGEHTLRVSGVLEGEMRLVTTYYQRVPPAVATPAAPAEPEAEGPLAGLL